jgi:protocatechuate 4,5-dioxygenase alpha chain
MCLMMIHLFISDNDQATLVRPPDQKEARVSITIPGTTPFDGRMAVKGYALNKMCFSFNEKAHRDAFPADPEAYMAVYGLTPAQAEAIRSKQVLALLAAGGNAYYLAKFAGIFGLDMQDIGAQQTGMSKEAFKAKLVAANDA